MEIRVRLFGKTWNIPENELTDYLKDKLTSIVIELGAKGLKPEETEVALYVITCSDGTFCVTKDMLDLRGTIGYTVEEIPKNAEGMLGKYELIKPLMISVSCMKEKVERSQKLRRIISEEIRLLNGDIKKILLADTVTAGWAVNLQKAFLKRGIDAKVVDIYTPVPAIESDVVKLIAKDNYCRDHISEYYISEAVPRHLSEELHAALIEEMVGNEDWYPLIVEQDYKLYIWEP